MNARRCLSNRACAEQASRVPLRSAGRALEDSVRTRFEPRFGVDFSRVRIHTDDQAAASARTLGARAYTIGEDVVFGRDEYAPHTARGAQLLAHELTHVVQQGRGTGGGGERVSEPGERSEVEAGRVGEGGDVSQFSPVSRGVVQRQTLDKPAGRPLAPPDVTMTRPILVPAIQPPDTRYKCTPRYGGFKYGCYCGAGKTCLTYDCPGVDALDECCRAHDEEYGDDCSFVDRMFGFPGCSDRIAAADARFCVCLSKAISTSEGAAKSFAQNAYGLFCISAPKELHK